MFASLLVLWCLDGLHCGVEPAGCGLGWVLVGLLGRGVGFAGVEVGGGLAGRLRGCVGADALVGVGVGGYLRGFGGRWCVVVWGVDWFGVGVAVRLVFQGGFFDGVRLGVGPGLGHVIPWNR
jgi:hypothetical protein